MAWEIPAQMPVRDPADVVVARRAATELALDLGFPEDAAHEIALVVSELGSNLVKYARAGTIVVAREQDGQRVGIRVESHDHGPGIASIDQAVRDGFSTGGSLGTGLGAVNRLMDSLDICTSMSLGTDIVAIRWIRAHNPPTVRCPLEVGVASIPKQGESANGDTFVVKGWSEQLLVGVIDGLGHGEPASRAARAARAYVQAHYDQPLPAIFRGAGIACRNTRGVVMALARIDWGSARISYASIGNIEARAVDYPGRFNVMVRRGIVGLNAPDPKVTNLPWPAQAVLILHSDGISMHWRWEQVRHLRELPAAQMAREMLGILARPQDDSTILVVRATEVSEVGQPNGRA